MVRVVVLAYEYSPTKPAPLNVVDLFSGIGGFALGFERAGMRVVALCESASQPRAVLARHWPGVPCYADIRRLSATVLDADGVSRPDVLCGGFPCQDISTAGRGAGLLGERSGLWHEMLRLVRELRPGWVVAENVAALRVRGADRVLADLAAEGYACWPVVVGAAHAGAPHRRQRAFILAYADRPGLEERLCRATWPAPGLPVAGCGGWPVEPGLGRMAAGLPGRLDRARTGRLRGLGNAVLPDIATAIGQSIMMLGTR